MDKLYRFSLWVAAIMNVATLLIILLGIVFRLLKISVGGLDAYAGYFLAGAFFLSTAETFKKNEHIKVGIVINNLKEPYKRYLNIFIHISAIYILGYMFYFTTRMVYYSYKFNDISQLPDATPMWIPQLSFLFGILVFLIAVLENFIKLIASKGKKVE